MTLSLYIFLCSFLVNKVQNAPTDMHSQIDEFIGHLMNSDKFNDLADNIAERAARKIKTVERSSNLTSLRQGYESDKSIKAKSIKEVRAHTNEDSVVTEKKKDEESSIKFGEINTKAFLKDDDSSQELHLKYKHIAKKKEDEKKSDVAKKVDNNLERDADVLSEHSPEQIIASKEQHLTVSPESNERKKHKKKTRNKEEKEFEISNEKHSVKVKNTKSKTSKKVIENKKSSHDFSGKDNSRETSREDIKPDKKHKKKQRTKKKVIDDNSSNWSNYETKKDTIHHPKHAKESQEHKIGVHKKKQEATRDTDTESDNHHEKLSTTQITNNIKEDSSFDWSDVDKKDNTNPPAQKEKSPKIDRHYSSKEIVEVAINRAHSDEEELNEAHSGDTTLIKNFIEKLDKVVSKEMRGTEKPTDMNRLVRRENGKIYTYRSSPDYDEYHDYLAHHRSKNNYINT